MAAQTRQPAAGTTLTFLENRIVAQIEEAEGIAISAVKAARQNLEQKLHGLNTAQEVHIARAKADIDTAAAALKASLDEFGRRLSALSEKK